MVFNYK